MDWLLLIVGLSLVTFGATWLTNGSVAFAKRLNISEYIIGMTIVAIGTSLPELTVSAASTFAGKADMAIGNVVGSNILNIFLILGTCSLIAPIAFSRNNIRFDIPICIAVSALVAIMLYDGSLSRIEGIILLLLFIATIVYAFVSNKGDAEISNAESDNTPKTPLWRDILLIVLGLSMLIYGARLTLDSATNIARALGISESIIAISVLALGTSLPELAAGIAAMCKGHSALALGNVLGSNIANILLILGFCSTISPLTMSDITYIDITTMAVAAIAVLISAFAIGHRQITRSEGVIYLLAYAAYIWYLISQH